MVSLVLRSELNWFVGAESNEWVPSPIDIAQLLNVPVSIMLSAGPSEMAFDDHLLLMVNVRFV